MRTIVLSVLILSLFIPMAAAQTTVAATLHEAVPLRFEPRGFPQDAYNIIGQVEAGTTVQVMGYARSTDYYGNGLWLQVNASGQIGWLTTEAVTFSHADWQTAVTHYQTNSEIKNAIAAVYGYLPTAVCSNERLHLRAEPSRRATILLDMLDGDLVHVLADDGQRDGNSMFAYVRHVSSGIEGWATAYGLCGFAQGYGLYMEGGLPVINQGYQPPANFQAQGQVIAWAEVDVLRLRSAPSTDAVILADLRRSAFVAVHGQAGEWVYASVIATGQNGWLYKEFLGYPREYDPTMLPLLDPVAPAMAPAPGTIPNLAATTNQETMLREIPVMNYPSRIEVVPVGTPITLNGRNVDSYWVQGTFEGYTVWIRTSHLNIDGDYNLLPITSTRSGFE